MITHALIQLSTDLERKEVVAEFISTPEGDHVCGLPGPLRLPGGLAVQDVHRLPGLHLPEARHDQLGVQIPTKYVTGRT